MHDLGVAPHVSDAPKVDASLAEENLTERGERREAASSEKKARPVRRQRQRLRTPTANATIEGSCCIPDEPNREPTRERKVSLHLSPSVVEMGDYEA